MIFKNPMLNAITDENGLIVDELIEAIVPDSIDEESRASYLSILLGMTKLDDTFIVSNFDSKYFGIRELFAHNHPSEEILTGESLSIIADIIVEDVTQSHDTELFEWVVEKQYSVEFYERLMASINMTIVRNPIIGEDAVAILMTKVYALISLCQDISREFLIEQIDEGHLDILKVGAVTNAVTEDDLYNHKELVDPLGVISIYHALVMSEYEEIAGDLEEHGSIRRTSFLSDKYKKILKWTLEQNGTTLWSLPQ